MIHRVFASISLIAWMMLEAPIANADAPTCATHSSGPYCSYKGIVQRVYVNSSNWILLYFDTSLDLNEVASVGLSGITISSACIYRFTDNPDYAKAFYASILSAQASGTRISVQMRGGISGYLQCDRIWVGE